MGESKNLVNGVFLDEGDVCILDIDIEGNTIDDVLLDIYNILRASDVYIGRILLYENRDFRIYLMAGVSKKIYEAVGDIEGDGEVYGLSFVFIKEFTPVRVLIYRDVMDLVKVENEVSVMDDVEAFSVYSTDHYFRILKIVFEKMYSLRQQLSDHFSVGDILRDII